MGTLLGTSAGTSIRSLGTFGSELGAQAHRVGKNALLPRVANGKCLPDQEADRTCSQTVSNPLAFPVS